MTVAVVRQQTDGATGQRIGAQLYVWCPGCDDLHGVGVIGADGSEPRVKWSWDGNLNAPTVSPSILVQYGKVAGTDRRCHSFLEAGRWRFLGDSTHELADREDVPMVPLPEWVVRDA